MKCTYCKIPLTDDDLGSSQIQHDGRSAYLCAACRENPKYHLQKEEEHLILLNSETDTRICLFCGQTQKFTADGDYEGVRFHVVPCLRIVPKAQPKINETDKQLLDTALHGADMMKRIHAVRKIRARDALEQITNLIPSKDEDGWVISEARLQITEYDRKWAKGRRAARELANLLLTTWDVPTWETAVPKINDQTILWELYRHLTSEDVDFDTFNRRTLVVDMLADEKALQHIAKKDCDDRIRIRATEKLRSGDLLRQLAEHDENIFVREAAVANPNLSNHAFFLEQINCENSHFVLEQLYKRIGDRRVIEERLAIENNEFVILALCKAHPLLSRWAEDIYTILATRSVSVKRDYEHTAQVGEKALAKWLTAAENISRVATETPEALELLWDKLADAVNNFTATEEYSESTGEWKTDYTDQGDIYNYEIRRTESLHRPVQIRFPKRPGQGSAPFPKEVR